MSKVSSPWPLLQKRFPPNEYALLAEVRDQAGFGASRSADGIAMNLWPSRGLEIEGIEVKSYRSDWLRELKDPAKAENIIKYCDRWWLVAADDTIVYPEEVPNAWGFLQVKGKRLMTIKPAPKLIPSAALDRSFIAALMKRATKGTVPASSIQEKIDEAVESAVKAQEAQRDYNLKYTQDELKKLQEMVLDFEQASGVKMDRWGDHKKIGEAVRLIIQGGLPDLEKRLQELKNRTAGIHDFICKSLDGVVKASEKEKESRS